MNQLFLLISILVSALGPSATTQVWAAPIPDPAYERLFPNYAEICGFGKKDRGNPGGHAILYVKGICRDTTGDRPLVRRCTVAELETHPHLGTGMSVDPIANNAWWVGVEDLDFILFGNITPDQNLDGGTFEELIQRATAEQTYGQIWPSPKKRIHRPLAIPLGKFLAGEGLGTDFGISLARQGSCWKIPLSPEQVDAIVVEANLINQSVNKNRPPRWNFLSNNCVHFVVNLLSAAGVMEYAPTGLPFPAFLASLEAPSTRILKTGRLVNKGIPPVTRAFKDRLTRRTLLKFQKLPLQYGTILETIRFHEQGNYDFKDNGRFALPGQLKKLAAMELEPKHTDLRVHLEMYLQDLLSARDLFESRPLEQLGRKKKYRSLKFARFYRVYGAWLETSLADLTAKIALL